MEDDNGPLAPGTVLDGKFRVLRLLGTGGMGAVYAVRHELTQHERALKLLHRRWREHPEMVERFLREASAAGRIDNPHICETYDAGYLYTGEPYLLMELLKGQPLEARLAREGTLPVAVAADLVAQACRGIQAAHDARIIHRDLKPENVMITERDGVPFVKLLDFGISKFEDAINTSRATKDGTFLGTPYYMSPEQFADGHDVDGRADVYSLGVILYECITGRPPFDVDTLAQLAKRVMLDEPAPPSSLRSLPPAVDAVVMRALQKDQDARYESADEMARELEKLTRRVSVTHPQGGGDWPAEAERLPRGEAGEAPLGERDDADTVVDPPRPLAAVEQRSDLTSTADTVMQLDAHETLEPIEAAPMATRHPAGSTAPAPGRLLWLGIAVALAAGALVLLLIREPADRGRSAGTSAPASASSAPVASTPPSAQTSTPPSVATAAPPATDSAQPDATASPPSPTAAPPPRPIPHPASPPSPPKPPDYATADEFP